MIRPYEVRDAEAVLILNEVNVPAVGPMDRAKLDLLVDESMFVDVIEIDDSIEGALFVLPDGAAYESPNYRWFSARYPQFVYVDRIMLSPATRGMGLGVQLYDRAVAAGRAHEKSHLLAEVNTEPANPRSLRFHEVYGFVEVGRERPYGPDEEVSMLALQF